MSLCLLSPPQNALLPAGLRQKDQTTKKATGSFNRDSLLKYLEKEAMEYKDREDIVPFTGEKKGACATATKWMYGCYIQGYILCRASSEASAVRSHHMLVMYFSGDEESRCVCVFVYQQSRHTAVITVPLSLQVLLMHVCSYATYSSEGEVCVCVCVCVYVYQGRGGRECQSSRLS